MAEGETHSIYENGKLYNINLEELEANPDQPRKELDSTSLKALRDTIKAKGVLQPIRFRQEDDKLFIVYGHRRVEAAKKEGQRTISAIFFEGNGEKAALAALIENIQREDLSPIEFAEALQRLIQDYDYSQQELSSRIGKSEATVSEILSLNNLPQQIRDECHGDRNISRSTLLGILKKKTDKEKKDAFTEYRAKHAGIPSRKVRPWAERLVSGCNKIKAIMDKEDIGSLDVETITTLEKKIKELKEGAERLLVNIGDAQRANKVDGTLDINDQAQVRCTELQETPR